MIISRDEYRKKVLGCWMGKNIGGTLGAPFEWVRRVNNVTFYTQDTKGEPLPNDDLDIQLLWLVALEEKGVDIDAHTLAEYWVLYVTPHWAEYGNAKVNLRAGLLPPLSGSTNNIYKDSCGAFIRSEIWACIAPGCPRVAARFAYEDAILDHGNGEGTYAEVFCAALESAAFVVSDVRKLIDIALTYIPADCGIAGAVRCALASFDSGKSWPEARDEILRKYRGRMAFNSRAHVSDEDFDKGFADGRLGWDAPSNVGIVIVGLLYGAGDFGKSLCTAVNCGEDTDCTAATAGSIFGIIHGIDGIPKKWIDPIGRTIKTATLNLGELGYFGGQLPADVDALTERTERVARQLILRRRLPLEIADGPSDVRDVSEDALRAGDLAASLYRHLAGPVFRFDCYQVAVDYGDGPFIRDSFPKKLALTITNTYKVPANVNIRWYSPPDWRILRSDNCVVFVGTSAEDSSIRLEFSVATDHVAEHTSRLVVELSIAGRPAAMIVPIVLLNGNATPQLDL